MDTSWLVKVVNGIHQVGQGEWGYCSPSCPCKKNDSKLTDKRMISCYKLLTHYTDTNIDAYNQTQF